MAGDHRAADRGSDTGVVRRSALLAGLAELAADDVPLILLEAPAGYGKTTLLRQWASEDLRPFVWVRLREVGDHPDDLLTSMTRALRRSGQHVPPTPAGAGPFPPSSGAAPLDGVLRALQERRRGCVLVLDSAGPMPLSSVAVIRLTTRLPRNCQLVVASREPSVIDLAAPPGSQRRLGPEQLAFTDGEARAALEATGVDSQDDVVRLLMQRTEGWPAGIDMAASALRERPGTTSAAVRAFSDGRLAEYLRAEVLEWQSPEIRGFLLETAVLGTLSGPLCDAVLGGTGAAARLAEIEGRNLFVRRVGAGGDRYRYHPLFAGMLRSELRRRHPARERVLRRRAAHWFVQNGQPRRAMEHAVAGGDLPSAARLLTGHTWTLIDGRDVQAACSWMEALGEEASRRYPPLGVTAAWVWAMAGDQPRAMRNALAAERGSFAGPLPDGSSSVASGVAMIRAAMAPLGVERMLLDAEQAFVLEPPGTPWHPMAALLLGSARLMNGDTAGAPQALERSVHRTSEPAPDTAQFGLALLAVAAAQRNEWAVAQECAAASAGLLRAHRREDHMSSVLTYAAGATVAVHLGRREDALRDTREASRVFRERSPVGFPWFAGQVALLLGAALLDLDDVPGARSMVTAARGHVVRLLTEGVLRDQLRRLEERLATVDRPHLDPAGGALSTAELRVLELLPTHLSLGEIGDRLHLSRNTVKSHVSAIHRKLDCSTRTDAVWRARNLGLLDVPGDVGGHAGRAG
jgi:LuxR family maltose regulon positive regulatory protein